MATKKQVMEAWERASTIRGKNPDTWRKDEMRNLIRKASYGTQGKYGWMVHHRNLRALHIDAKKAG
jgi:hypothetical protein